ncbi:MAG: hypothetical protein AAF211_12445 [Myxococcota bacterium]
MKWIATLTNFFLPGLGYLVAVPHKRVHGLLYLAGALGLTYVEQVAVGPEHPAFWPLFASVFVMNTAFAYDAYQEASLIERSGAPA